eukprot:NODE_18081_length_213_cov_219.227848.p3 GENE.NODE_18081_length_213_cov_219.227848~~NODE_18081_length_213_cov_219.227848.p3  ORF type:complete len:57 (+),score=7.68 NODE_18081_length_213_cov_219.227848:3-173(+)
MGQVGLKWVVQQGRPLATGVAKREWMVEDLDLWRWNLTDGEVSTLTSWGSAQALVI